MSTLLLAELLVRRVRVEPHEAVAIAQQLIACGGAAPTPDKVRLGSDGSVECVGCDATPAVYELAIFLQTLMPFERVGIPGGLRYAIARGLHEVEARPFDSLDEFSRALVRFERGDRRSVVGHLVRRVSGDRVPIAAATAAPIAAATAAPIVVAPPLPPPAVIPAARASQWRAPAVAAAIAGCAIGSLLTAGLIRTERHAIAPPQASTAHPAAQTSSPARTEAPAARVGSSPPPAAALRPQRLASLAPARVRERATLQTRASAGGQIVAALDAHRRPVFSPAFASNSSALFFHTGGPHDARSAIAVSNKTSGYDLQVMTILDDGARNYHVQPSPDGRTIAFDSDRDGERGVYIANRDGSDVRRVSGTGYAAVPTWSPDGRRLAYIRAEASNPRVWNLWIQSLDDGRVTRLTNYKYGQTWSASWFPDNRRVCYSHEDTLVIANLETGRDQRFASPVKGRLVRTPAVSPDGTKVIFQVFRQGAWMLDVADGSMRFVLTDPTAEEFAWAPDGRRVAFHSRRDGQWGMYVIAE